MVSESKFQERAEDFLEAIAAEIEAKDEDMLIDVDLTQGVLTLELDSGQQYIINRHDASKQLWLSSPISGGLHYDYNENSEGWELTKDGSRLDELLTEELYQHTGIAFDFIGD